MGAKLNLKKSEKLRMKLNKTQQKEIFNMYDKLQKSIAYKISGLSKKENISSKLKIAQLNELSKRLDNELNILSKELSISINNNMSKVIKSVIEDNEKFLKAAGFKRFSGWQNLPDEIIKKISTGKIYKEGWGLSQRIWGIKEKTMKDIHSVIAEGITLNKSSFDIAKDLEKYVSPSAKKDWKWSKVYPGSNKVVDYNAQRLARTLTSHAYQQAFIETTKKNPFVEKYRWLSAGIHGRTCDICNSRNGELFDKNKLPLDHPNGLCTFEAVITKSAKEIADEVAKWHNSPEGTNKALDSFAKSLGYNPKANTKKPTTIKTEVPGVGTKPKLVKPKLVKSKPADNITAISIDDFVGKYGKFKKTWSSWVKSLDGEMKEQAKILKAKEGTTWEKWYKKNIFDGDISDINKTKKINETKKVSATEDDYKDWISKVKKNKESDMLKWEDEIFDKFTDLEKDSIKKYTGQDYESINYYLRSKAVDNEIKVNEHIEDATKNIKSALGKSKLEEDLYVRRGSNRGDLAGLFMEGNFDDNRNKLLDLTVNELNKMFNGSIGEYAGFTSTSSLYDRGFSGHVEMIIKIPKEADAASIMRISSYGTSEGETLLNAGTKVRCLGIEKADGHKRSKIRVFLEVMV